MAKVWKGSLLLLLLLLMLVPSAAAAGQDIAPLQQAEESDTAALRVIPNEGKQGDSHTVLVSGLLPGEAVTIRILFDATDAEVYSTDRTADPNGRVELSIFTSLDDTPGDYTVQVLNRSGDVLDSATLTVLEPIGQDGSVTVASDSDTAGAVFTFSIRDVRPFASLSIRVVAPNQQTVFSTDVRASVDGEADVDYPSEPQIDGGTYTVEVRDGENLVASTEFEVQAVQVGPAVEVLPAVAAPGDALIISVTGLEPETGVQVDVLAGDEVLTTLEGSADVNGTAIFSYSTPDDAASGEYTVNIVQDGEVIASTGYMLSTAPAVALSIAPESGERGTAHDIVVEGLAPESALELVVLYEGEEVFSTDATADAEGVYEIRLTSETSDPAGEYTVNIVQDGEVIASGTLTITEDVAQEDADEPDDPDEPQTPTGEPGVTIAPEVVPQGDPFTVDISGLEARETVVVDILFDDEVVYSTERTADALGNVQLRLRSETSDPLGHYTVQVSRTDAEPLSAQFIIDEAGTTTTPPDTPSDEVTVSTAPDSIAIGETVTVTVDGLEPDETVTVDVIIGEQEVFSTTRTANEDGSFELLLMAEPGDAVGTYEVIVRRDNGEFAVGTFAITGDSATTPDTDGVEVTIEPQSITVGQAVDITISGLEPGEAVEVEVFLDEASVIRTPRTADENGVALVTLIAEESDPSGTYDVVLIRGDEEMTIGSFEVVNETTTTPPETDDEVQVGVEPTRITEGEIVTVTVTGLEPDESVTLDVLFDGESVVSLERTADATGTVEVQLRAEETDPAGNYVVVISRDEQQIAVTSFAIDAVAADADGDEVLITVEPETTTIGETFTITVTGLEPNESVTLELLFGDETLVSDTAIADEAGEISLELTSTTDDDPGTYTVRILREGDVVASTDFVVEAAVTLPPEAEDVTVDVQPTAGPTGTVHTVTVTGLQPNEDVLLTVTYNALTVFSTTVTADAEGTVTQDLITEEGDVPGDYTVNVVREEEVLGSAVFTLDEEAVVQDDAPVSGSEVIEGTLTNDTPQQRFTFSAEAGETVLITLDSPDFDTYLILEDTTGLELQYNDDSRGSLNSQIGPFTLPATGEYTVVVSSFNYVVGGSTATGDFTLRIERVGLTQIAYDESTTVTFDEASATQFLTLDATAGDVISITVDSGGSIDTVLSIADANGFTLVTDDDGGAGLDPEVQRFVVPSTGTYTITLSAFNPGDAGQATVTVTRTATRDLTDGAQTISLNSKVFSDVLTLEAQAGEAIQLNITLLSGNPRDLNITVQQNGMNLMSFQSFGIPSSLTLGFVVPDDGEVVIRVQDFGNAVSEMEFSITRE